MSRLLVGGTQRGCRLSRDREPEGGGSCMNTPAERCAASQLTAAGTLAKASLACLHATTATNQDPGIRVSRRGPRRSRSTQPFWPAFGVVVAWDALARWAQPCQQPVPRSARAWCRAHPPGGAEVAVRKSDRATDRPNPYGV